MLVGDGDPVVVGRAGRALETAAETFGSADNSDGEAAASLPFVRQVVSTATPLFVEDACPHDDADDRPAVGSFAGVPLTTADGLTLGALCVASATPLAWTTTALEDLRDLAAAAVAELARKQAVAALQESETRFRQIAESIDEVFWLADPVAYRIRYVSPAFERLWGIPVAAFYADTNVIAPFIHPDDRDAAFAAFERMRRQEQREVEYRIVRRDGAVRWVSNRSFPVHDADGRVVGAAGVASDVTDRKQAEVARRAQDERFRALVEHASDVTSVLAADGAVLYQSPAGARVLGYRPEEVVGRSAFDFVHPDDVEEVRARFAEVLRAPGAATAMRYRWRHRDGTWRTIEAHGWNLVDHPHVLGVVLNARDVTERETLERRLRQAETLEAVGRLAGGIAHEFNNLLTVIVGSLEFLRVDIVDTLPADHPARCDVAELQAAVDRARALVRQLLGVSRHQPLPPRRVDVGALARRAEGWLRRLVGEEIVLAVHVADDDSAGGPLAVVADAARLEHVLINLATNARDALMTPRHGRPGAGGAIDVDVDRVTGDGAMAAHWVRLRVRDTGHGMDAETQRHAFEPFFTTKPTGQGTGLGLATVSAVVRQSGGSVHLESAPGSGTTVTILLPATEPPEVPHEGTSASVPSSSATATALHAPTATPAAEGETILLVEDEAAVRTMWRQVLERRGYTVLEARHGADALLLWDAHRDDVAVVITDLRMPEMGGRELVARLRAERPTLPVVTISGNASTEDGANGGPWEVFLAKPFTGDTLLHAITRVRTLHPTGAE